MKTCTTETLPLFGHVRIPLMVADVQRRTKKNGEPFLTLGLRDAEGVVAAKIWDRVEEAQASLQVGVIALFDVEVGSYQGKPDLKINSFSLLAPDNPEYPPQHFLPAGHPDTPRLWQELCSTLNQKLSRPHFRLLVERIDQTYGQAFQQHFGAQKIHHAHAGGLLEHTLGVLNLAWEVARLYRLDTDILVMGVLIHDLGKIEEFSLNPLPQTTLPGAMLGHIVLGTLALERMIESIPDFPESDRLHLLHLLVSHHGEREFGAPEVPKTAEAFALHFLDNLDSKLQIVREQTAQVTDASAIQTEFIPALGRRLICPSQTGRA